MIKILSKIEYLIISLADEQNFYLMTSKSLFWIRFSSKIVNFYSKVLDCSQLDLHKLTGKRFFH